MFPIPWNFPFRKKDGSVGKIEDLGESYSLPTASASTKGGIKVGEGLTITGEVLSADAQIPTYSSEEAGKALKVDENGDLIWDTAGSGGGEDGIYAGLSDPDVTLGEDGNFYLKCEKVTGRALVPQCDSSSTGVISSGDDNVHNHYNYMAFDRDNETYWSAFYTDVSNQAVGYDLGSGNEAIATKVKINFPRTSSNNTIKDFKIQGSNNGNTWVDLYTGSFTNDGEVADVDNYITMQNTTAYRYYRLFVTNTWNGQVPSCNELQFYTGDEGVVSTIDVLAEYVKQNGAWVAM